MKRMRIVMRDYHRKSAPLNMKLNAKYWATYFIKHSSSENVPVSVKKTLEIMIVGLNWLYNVYQPQRNKLYTNLVKQQYLSVQQLRFFIFHFKYIVSTHAYPPEYELTANQRHSLHVCWHLYREYRNSIFNDKNAIWNLDKTDRVLQLYSSFE